VRQSGIWTYENGLVLLMCLTNGVVIVDRSAVSYLSPYIVSEFKLDNTQLGLLASALSIAIAASGFALASLADSTGRRKQILIVVLVLFSIFSAFSGLAGGFATLLLARAALGLAEGPISPILQSVTSIESSPHRRGFNMGVALNLGAALVGLTLGPILATHLAEAFGWRSAFFVSCVPGLLLALAIALWMRPVRQPAPAAAAAEPHGRNGLWAALTSRNMLLCIVISGLYSAWLLVQAVFLPLYLVRVDGLKPTDMGVVISIAGVAAALAGLAVPALSDRIGRRPALAMVTTFGVLAPLAVLFVHGPAPLLTLALLIGNLGGGAGPLYVGIVPTESVPPAHVTTAVAVSLASGELIGGVAAPAIAGRAADLYGLGAPFWITAGCALVCGALSLLLVETAPAKVRPAIA
jgi:predicted MFS family arabinose efflux permease